MARKDTNTGSESATLAMLVVVLVASLLSPAAAAQEGDLVLAAEDAERETIAMHRLTIHPDGMEEIAQEGSQLVTLRDGTVYWIDLDELEDPDGNRYLVVGDAYQETADGPVVYETRLQRFEPREATDDEIRDEYAALHPEAAVEEIDEFMLRRDEAHIPQIVPRYIDPELDEWLEGAAADEELELTLLFEDQPALDLPRLEASLLEDEPAVWMALSEERLLAIESFTTEQYATQDDFLVDYLDLGVRDVRNYWVFNGVTALFSRDAVETLLLDGRVQRLEVTRPPEPASTTGIEILEATQLTQFLDAGFDGHRNSGRNPWVSDIYAMIFDTSITQGHVAWKDGTGPDSRLLGVYRDDDGNGLQLSSYSRKPTDEPHGNYVATQFVADLTDDQDPNITPPSHQLRKTGTTTETVFTFVMDEPYSDIPEAAELAIAFGVDVMNISYGSKNPSKFCDPNDSSAVAINKMMHHGVFVVASAGNEHGDWPFICNAGPQASASGSFAVGAYQMSAADLNSADIWGDSSRGGDANGRPIVQMTASSGRQGTNMVSYDIDTYEDMTGSYQYGGTSFAAPIVAGAAADLKDFFIGYYGQLLANKVGLMFANMLLMGDGEIEDGNQEPTTPVDPRWGVGRLRMRMFNEVGMDSPWRHRWGYCTLSQSEVFELALNPDASDVNQPVPEDVEFFRAALWFHEPNLGTGVNTSVVPFLINQDGTGNTYLCSSAAPQSQRLFLEDQIRAKAWTIKATGGYLPASLDPQDPWYGETKRRIFVAAYFEDRDRDEPHPGGDIL